MGAIVQWIITHAQRVAAWAMLLAAVGALIFALDNSGAFRDLSNNLSAFGTLLETGSQKVPVVTQSFNAAINQAITDGEGWVQLICYMVYLDGFGEITTLLSANFQAILVATFACASLCAGMMIAVFVFTRQKLLSNAVSGSLIAA